MPAPDELLLEVPRCAMVQLLCKCGQVMEELSPSTRVCFNPECSEAWKQFAVAISVVEIKGAVYRA